MFWLDVPRLSVDIDINYVRRADLDGMRADRPAFEAAMLACCEREGCSVRRAPQEHAGGKFHLRYSGGIGGGGSLEMDLAGVDEVDSAAVSLLFAWLRQAGENNVSLVFVNLPANLASLATLYGVLDLIPQPAH